MARFRFYILLLTCPVALSVASTEQPASTPSTSPLATKTSKPLQYLSNYYYMDDPTDCNGAYSTGAIHYLSYGENAFVRAYDKTYRRSAKSCTMTFGSYGDDGMKFRFSNAVSNYIHDCSVTLNIYSGSSVYGTLLATYSCFSALSTNSYISTHKGYVTVQLIVLTQRFQPDYYFSLQIQNWDDTYFNGGDIAGLVVGLFLFLVIFLSIILCVRIRRRRRRLLAQPPIVNTAPSTTANYPAGQVPYPNNYGAVNNPPYPPPTYPPAGSTQPYPSGPAAPPYQPAAPPYQPAAPPYQPADSKPEPPTYNP